jgi:hypothetical protein
MTAETFEVMTAPTLPEAAMSAVGSAGSTRQLDLKIWTAVTDVIVADQPRGTPALVVLDGVSRALSARIYESGDEVSVEDLDTGVFGTGDSLPDAARDLRDALHDHLDVLASEQGLAPNLQHQLEILRSYFPTL